MSDALRGCCMAQLCLWRAVHSHSIRTPLQLPSREELLCCSKSLLQGTGAVCHFTGASPDTNQGHRQHVLHQRLGSFQEMDNYSTNQYDTVASALTISCLYNMLIHMEQYFVYVNVFENI